MPSSPAVSEELSPHRFRWDRVRKGHFLAIAALHVACVFAFFHFSWSALAVTVFLLWLTASLGLSGGYHRLLTHRAFETSRFGRFLFAMLGAMCWQGGPIWWVGTHRIHHSEADHEGDPHSPHHGFVWGHMLWCLVEDPFDRDVTQAAKDLKKAPELVWLDRWFMIPNILLGVGLFLVGGWSWLLWGFAVRTVFCYHATWFVNSASHLWGYRNFETKEESRNNWWVALISWGEGWHNNHHAHQRSAKYGVRWFEVDVTWWALRVLGWVGLVRNLQVPRLDAK